MDWEGHMRLLRATHKLIEMHIEQEGIVEEVDPRMDLGRRATSLIHGHHHMLHHALHQNEYD